MYIRNFARFPRLTDNQFTKEENFITLTKPNYKISIDADFTTNSVSITALDNSGVVISTLFFNKG